LAFVVIFMAFSVRRRDASLNGADFAQDVKDGRHVGRFECLGEFSLAPESNLDSIGA
jgi:hypothetical protein